MVNVCLFGWKWTENELKTLHALSVTSQVNKRVVTFGAFVRANWKRVFPSVNLSFFVRTVRAAAHTTRENAYIWLGYENMITTTCVVWCRRRAVIVRWIKNSPRHAPFNNYIRKLRSLIGYVITCLKNYIFRQVKQAINSGWTNTKFFFFLKSS